MRSKASFRGHPIHPALIPFPFAFLYGAFVFDAIGRALARPTFWMTGGYLAVAGIVTALVAAVPGFVDYFFTVPPRSTGKRRATKHLLANSSAVVLFALAWWLRGDIAATPGIAQLLLEALATGLLTVGGWLGGVLVNRNMIGVDPRYANAGKWSETSVEAKAGEPAVVARADELQVNQMKLVRINSTRIVLGRTERGYVAFDDHCTHRGGSLAGGMMICGTVQCPWHGSQFDVHSGAVKSGPAKEQIATYRVDEQQNAVRLFL